MLEGRVRWSNGSVLFFRWITFEVYISWCQSYVPTKGSSRKIHLECVTFFQNERVKTEITCAALSKGIWWESNLTAFFLAVECYSWSKNYGFMKILIHFLLFTFLVRKKRRSGVMHCDYLKVMFSVFSAYLYKCAELSYQSFSVRA